MPRPTTAAFANQSLGLRTTAYPFDYFPASRCINVTGAPLQVVPNVRDHSACEALCTANTKCMAAQFDHPWGPTEPCTNETNPVPSAEELRKLGVCLGRCNTTSRSDSSLAKCDAWCQSRRLSLRLKPCLLQPRCVLYDFCLERVAAPQPTRSDVMHRWGPTWPPGVQPKDVVWKTNATVVIVSYKNSLSWLRSLPGGMLDVVVYHKYDLGHPNISYPPMGADYILGHLAEQELCGYDGSGEPKAAVRRRPVHDANFSARVASERTPGVQMARTMEVLATRKDQRLHFPNPKGYCAPGCVCGRREQSKRPRLQYFAVLPNYGQARVAPYGGSREPYGYFQFVLDFWDNLPPVTIFTQDDCLARGCGWGVQLPALSERLKAWEHEWGEHKAPSKSNCLCKFIREENYMPKAKYYWYRFMSFAQEQLFGTNLSARNAVVTWPQDATFAVSRANILNQPRWMFEGWTRLMTTERACMGVSTISWAHTLERIWFELFDENTPKALKDWSNSRDSKGACFLGARRRRLRRRI